MNSTKIKICGLFRDLDAAYVSEARPDYAGFVFYPPSRRAVTPEQAAALRALINPEIATVGVFVDADPAFIAALYGNGTISVAQLHGHEGAAYIASLRNAAPGCVIWQAFKIRTAADLSSAAASSADMVLLDNGRGTGERFDWGLTKEIGRPFILAGGLNPENIHDAVGQLHPFAVDLSSGVETDGVKDRDKILAAVKAARRDAV